MGNKVKYVIAIIIAIIVAEILTYNFIYKDHKSKIEFSDTTYAYRVDTIKVEYPVYITKWKAKLDTLIIEKEKVIVASADTTFIQDSSQFSIKYYSPPLNHFDINAYIRPKIEYRYKEKVITNYVEAPTHWYDGFGHGIHLTLGIDTQGKPNAVIGYGVHYEF
ncbi:MAG: hypothetical protein ABIJ40_18300 [Bacteroidota bacterium]